MNNNELFWQQVENWAISGYREKVIYDANLRLGFWAKSIKYLYWISITVFLFGILYSIVDISFFQLLIKILGALILLSLILYIIYRIDIKKFMNRYEIPIEILQVKFNKTRETAPALTTNQKEKVSRLINLNSLEKIKQEALKPENKEILSFFDHIILTFFFFN